jgi:hypothetical protein
MRRQDGWGRLALCAQVRVVERQDELSMSDLFDVDGTNLDRGFENLKTAEFTNERQLRAMLQEMWTRYEPYADPDFRQGFARDVDGRFWEMYLGCTLLEAGALCFLESSDSARAVSRTCASWRTTAAFGSRPSAQTKAPPAPTRSCDPSRPTKAGVSSMRRFGKRSFAPPVRSGPRRGRSTATSNKA